VAVVQYTQSILRTTQIITEQHNIITTEQHKDDSTTQKIIILKRCGPCPDFASLTLAFVLKLRKSTENPQLG